ncbi:MAG TPA: hypothetical protein VGK73_34555 [Polyangiaceae bacterium]
MPVLLILALGCSETGKKSAELSVGHVKELAAAAREDVRQVRTGLPLGAAELSKLLPAEGEIPAATAREALEKARSKVADLRVAKSTFFAVVLPDGLVLRNDREQDRMVGKNLFDSFPGARPALQGGYVETRGSMPEAAEVRGRPDAQWVAAAPVGSGRALYATGWSWSSYAYRLQNALLSSLRGTLTEHQKMPLLYVFVAVDKDVYGVAEAPDVNIDAVKQQAVNEKLKGSEPFSIALELTGRSFGLAAIAVPELGPKVSIVVLRSEV